MRTCLAALALLAVSLQPAMAQGETPREIAGTLTCKAGAAEDVTEPVLRDVSCTYEPAKDGPERIYTGDIINKGPEGPPAQRGASEVLVWNVWIPKNGGEAPELLGKYQGVREDNPAQTGLGANTLVGGEGDTILLEPVVNPGTGEGPGQTRTVIELELKAPPA